MSDGRLQAHEVVRSLVDVGDMLVSNRPLGERLESLLAQTAALLGCDRCSIMMWDGERFRGTYNWGNPPDIAEVFESYSAPLEAPLIREAFDTGSFVVVNHALSDPHLGKVAERARIESMVLAPMIDLDETPLGFLTAEYNEQMKTFGELGAEVVVGVALLARAAIVGDRDRQRRVESEAARRKLRERLIEAEDRERRRISHDIHDDVLQRMSSFAHYLELAADQFDGDELLTRQLNWLHGEARSAAITLRRLVTDLLPVDVVDRTLKSALEGVVQSATQLTDIDIELQVGRTGPVPENVRGTIARIARQAIDNALRHANASRIEVMFDSGDTVTTLSVTDDGDGFDPTAAASTGIGLLSMTERAELLDGTCSVLSSAGSGTTVEALIPHVANRVAEPDDFDTEASPGSPWTP